MKKMVKLFTLQVLIDVWVSVILHTWLQNETMLTGYNVNITTIIPNNDNGEKGNGTSQK